MVQRGPDRFGELLFYGVVLLVGYLAYIVVRPFLTPLVWAAILSMTIHPLQRRLEPRIGPTAAAVVTTLTTLLVIIGPLVTLISMIAGDVPRALAFVQTLPKSATPENVQMVWDMIRTRVPFELPEDPTTLATQAAQRAIAFLAPQVGAILANIASTTGSLFVMLFAMFFFLRDGASFGSLLRRMLPFDEEERERLIGTTRDLVIASVGAGLTVAATQGFIGGITFWALGVAGAAAWGVVIAMCALIPVVGAALIWAPLAAWWLMTGDVVRGLVLAGVGAGIIGMADNILRPLLLSGRTSANGLVIFIGLLGGVGAFGFVGLVIGPIVLVTAGTLIEALTRHKIARSTAPME